MNPHEHEDPISGHSNPLLISIKHLHFALPNSSYAILSFLISLHLPLISPFWILKLPNASHWFNLTVFLYRSVVAFPLHIILFCFLPIFLSFKKRKKPTFYIFSWSGVFIYQVLILSLISFGCDFYLFFHFYGLPIWILII